jgi:hypothetical protein
MTTIPSTSTSITIENIPSDTETCESSDNYCYPPTPTNSPIPTLSQSPIETPLPTRTDAHHPTITQSPIEKESSAKPLTEEETMIYLTEEFTSNISTDDSYTFYSENCSEAAASLVTSQSSNYASETVSEYIQWSNENADPSSEALFDKESKFLNDDSEEENSAVFHSPHEDISDTFPEKQSNSTQKASYDSEYSEASLDDDSNPNNHSEDSEQTMISAQETEDSNEKEPTIQEKSQIHRSISFTQKKSHVESDNIGSDAAERVAEKNFNTVFVSVCGALMLVFTILFIVMLHCEMKLRKTIEDREKNETEVRPVIATYCQVEIGNQ